MSAAETIDRVWIVTVTTDADVEIGESDVEAAVRAIPGVWDDAVAMLHHAVTVERQP